MQGWDLQIFEWLNQRWVYTGLDSWMILWRTPKTWIPLYAIMLFIFQRYWGWKGMFGIILSTAVLIFVTDFLIAGSLKHGIQRLRPCHRPELHTRLLIQCGSGYSFISAHAANHMGLAAFWGLLLRDKLPGALWVLVFWALGIAWAQVYVGVHFPFDVLAGAFCGFLSGVAIFFAFQKWRKHA